MQTDLFPETVPKKVLQEENLYYCNKCKEMKEESEFYPSAIEVFKSSKTSSGRGGATYCKCCQKDYNRTKAIAEKLAPRKPVEMYACECCGVMTEPDKLLLDHDHITGAFRGWLCRGCNSSIGGLGDNIEGLEMAISYLKRAYGR